MEQAAPEVLVEGEFLLFKTPYSPEYVQELKDRIPQRWREWVPQTKAWKVHVAFRDIALAVFERHFPADRPALPEGNAPEMTRAEAFEVLWLIEGAPRELIDAAYRELNIIYEDDPRISGRIRTAYSALVQAQHDSDY